MAKSKWINKKLANRKVRPAAQNPSSTKFRDQIKWNSKKPVNTSNSMKLTTENLIIHDAMIKDSKTQLTFNSDNQICDQLSDQLSLNQDSKSKFSLSIGNTEFEKFKGFADDKLSDAQTFATCFTNCTNASFSYFLQKFNQNNSVHKEMLSILAAATDIINDQKDKESDEKYFDLLINSIYTAESTLFLTANIILLYYVIKRMNEDNLKSRFSSFQQLTSDLLKKYLNSSNVTFIKFLLKSYFIFLKTQDDCEWDNSITRTSFVDNLLALTIYSKSRIRKIAKECVVELFKNEKSINHPIFDITTEFAIRKIKETSGSDITDALYVLNLWKEIVHFLPSNYLKLTCEQLLGLLALGNVLIFTNSMQVLENLFKSSPQYLNCDLNYKIIQALYDSQPIQSDHQPLLAWCSVTKYAELNLFNLTKQLFIEHILKLLAIYFHCLQSSNKIVRSFACQCINEILDKAIESKNDFNSSVFIVIGESLRVFIDLKHMSIWRLILRIYSIYFKLTGPQFNDIMKRSFSELLELKNLNCDESKDLRFDYPIRSLLQYHGVEFVMEHINLEPDFSNYTIKNIWLIDILRQNSKNNKIVNFNKYILVQALKICPDFKQYTINDDSPWLFSYMKLWSLLPVFLNEPIDIKENFKTIAKTLGDGLSHAPQLRPYIMKSLRQLIIKSKGDDLTIVANYSKNFIPILLNLYLSDLTKNKAMKTTIYQTLSCFFSINDQALTEKIYSKVFENKETEKDPEKKSLYLDILRCIICNLKDEEKILNGFEFALKLSAKKDNKLEQKKAFRLIEELIKSPLNYKIICDYYEKKGELFYENIIKFYLQEYSSVSIFAAQASFTRIMQYILNEQFKEQKLSFEEFKRFVPIIINTLQSKKSAKLSCSIFDLLNNCMQLMENGVNQVISTFIELLNENEINIDRKATLIFILHNILIKHKEKINNQMKNTLLTALLENLTNENRKVVNVLLVFLNDWFKISNKDEMLPYITKFIDYLNTISNPCAPQFKYKIKNIIEKILKKFGAELVVKMLNSKYQRLIRIMLKNVRRNKKNKVNKNNSVIEFDDDEDIEETDDKIREYRKSKKNKRWRFDEDEDFNGFKIFDEEPNDQADNDVKVKPSSFTKRESFNQVFRINENGEIISDEETPKMTSNNKRKNESTDDESSGDEFEAKPIKKNRKPKRK